jgi:hypothetical protein
MGAAAAASGASGRGGGGGWGREARQRKKGCEKKKGMVGPHMRPFPTSPVWARYLLSPPGLVNSSASGRTPRTVKSWCVPALAHRDQEEKYYITTLDSLWVDKSYVPNAGADAHAEPSPSPGVRSTHRGQNGAHCPVNTTGCVGLGGRVWSEGGGGGESSASAVSPRTPCAAHTHTPPAACNPAPNHSTTQTPHHDPATTPNHLKPTPATTRPPTPSTHSLTTNPCRQGARSPSNHPESHAPRATHPSSSGPRAAQRPV